VGFVEGEADYCFESCVTGDGGIGEDTIDGEDPLDIKEEVSVKVEETIDTTDGIPEAVTCTPVTTEHEVRPWSVCVVVAAHAVSPFIDTILNL
jgi:hypothetical protein